MRLETKQDFRDWMFSVLNPLKPLYSEGGARLHLGDSGVTSVSYTHLTLPTNREV